MIKGQPDATLAVDSKLAARLAGPVLPFSGAAGGADVTCHVLEPLEGATAIPIAVGVFPWRLQGALRLTVIVKATFSFADDGPVTMGGDPPYPPAQPVATPIAADPLQVRDVHHKGQPLAHVTAASDRVPWKTAVDVTLLGDACAPGGTPVTEVRARFALSHGSAAVIDKTVRVIGNRGSKDAAPKPFARMPITYERTHGGAATPTNPIGCGGEDDDQPNILDPENPWRPAGFGPIPAAWPLRHKRLGETPRRDIDAPIMELPQGFPFAYFQSAPQEQQLPALQPDAVVLLEGFHPTRARIQFALPCVRAVGAAYGLDEADPDAPSVLPFRLDTLHVDADRQIATLVWRAFVAVRDEAQLGRIAIAAGAGVIGREPAVPGRRPQPGQPSVAAAALAPAPAASGAASTMTLDLVPAPSAKLPFGKPASPMETLDLSVAQVALPPPVPAIAAPLVDPNEGRSAAPFFHDLSKRRDADDVIPRAKDEPPPPPKPEEEIALERYAAICAALAEKGAARGAVLEGAKIDPATFRKAERHWKGALERESRRGESELRDRFDEAFVAAWEQQHPDRFGIEQYARVRRAEQRGRLPVELSELGLEPTLGMRLRRVWRRRIDADPAKREALDRALAAPNG